MGGRFLGSSRGDPLKVGIPARWRWTRFPIGCRWSLACRGCGSSLAPMLPKTHAQRLTCDVTASKHPIASLQSRPIPSLFIVMKNIPPCLLEEAVVTLGLLSRFVSRLQSGAHGEASRPKGRVCTDPLANRMQVTEGLTCSQEIGIHQSLRSHLSGHDSGGRQGRVGRCCAYPVG